MTDTKTVPGITYSPVSTVVPESKRAEMYTKLDLSQEEIDFLENPYREKFLTRFEIGSEKLLMYGSPVHMAGKSDLIKTVMTYDPPYVLAKDMLVYGGALNVLWLFMNGYQSTESVKKLSLAGWLNLNTLVGYFGVTDQVLMDELGVVGFMDRTIAASDQELKDNATVIANLINRHATKENIEGFREGMGKMMFRVRNINEILEKLNSTHILRLDNIVKSEYGESDRIIHAGMASYAPWATPEMIAKEFSSRYIVDKSGLIVFIAPPHKYVFTLYPKLVILVSDHLMNSPTYVEEFAKRRINLPPTEDTQPGQVV